MRVVHPFLVRLAAETNESAIFSVWTDHGALILDSAPSSRAFKPMTYPGTVSYTHLYILAVQGLVFCKGSAVDGRGPLQDVRYAVLCFEVFCGSAVR